MENASKALLIAGGVLIAILILSIGVYLFATYGQIGETYEQNLTSGEIKKFNSNFIKFEGRDNIKAQEIVTLYKFIKSYNEKNDINISTSIATLEVEGTSVKILSTSTAYLSEENLVEFIEQYSNKDTNPYQIIYFECTQLKYNENTGMVNKIVFKEL